MLGKNSLDLDPHSIKQPGLRFCWMGGDTTSKRPDNWFAPWLLEVAHIASGQGRARRVADRRAVVLLSSLAHRCHVSDSEKLPFIEILGRKYSTFDERHTLWIKRFFDPDYYDTNFLSTIWIGKVPEPVKPPEEWAIRMLSNQGVMF